MSSRKRKRPNNTTKKPVVVKTVEYIEENAEELLCRLKEGDPLDEDTYNKVLGVSEGACIGQRHKVEYCENRPCCFRELFPNEGKSRIQGLWSKNVVTAELKKLDPCLQRREKDEPCGLLNMGQTCYVNGVLQILYAIDEFRKRVLSVQFENGEKVLLELQRLFVSMESSPGRCSDPTELIEALQICPRTQEDGWEFLKSLLEKLPGEIGELLKGRLRYDTVCQGCKARSQCSDRQEDFLEILVPIENRDNLEQALQDVMDHDVDAWCDICGRECVIRRQTRLVQLPRILLFSLMRAAFSNSGAEVKDRSNFNIPYQIQMSMDLQQPQEDVAAGSHAQFQFDQQYHLKGVLQHQGHGSTKGHYVAQVQHGSQWWEFNDETVVQLNASSSRRTIQNKPSTSTKTSAINSNVNIDGFTSRDAYMLVYQCTTEVQNSDNTDNIHNNNNNNNSNNEALLQQQNKQDNNNNHNNPNNVALLQQQNNQDNNNSNNNLNDKVLLQQQSKQVVGDVKMNVVMNAVGVGQPEEKSQSQSYLELVQESSDDFMEISPDLDAAKKRRKRSDSDDGDYVPKHLKQLHSKIVSQDRDMQQQEEWMNGLQEYVDSRRAECSTWKKFLSSEGKSEWDQYIFIPSWWLWSWANEVQKPSQIDTHAFRCHHGLINPSELKRSCKRVPLEFWNAMVKKWGLKDASPLLNLDFVCQDCLKDWCEMYYVQKQEERSEIPGNTETTTNGTSNTTVDTENLNSKNNISKNNQNSGDDIPINNNQNTDNEGILNNLNNFKIQTRRQRLMSINNVDSNGTVPVAVNKQQKKQNKKQKTININQHFADTILIDQSSDEADSSSKVQIQIVKNQQVINNSNERKNCPREKQFQFQENNKIQNQVLNNNLIMVENSENSEGGQQVSLQQQLDNNNVQNQQYQQLLQQQQGSNQDKKVFSNQQNGEYQGMILQQQQQQQQQQQDQQNFIQQQQQQIINIQSNSCPDIPVIELVDSSEAESVQIRRCDSK